MTCREAILRTLKQAGRPLNASEIAEAINVARSYVRADGRPLPAYQVYAVAYQSEELFEIEQGRIRATDLARADPKVTVVPQQKGQRLIIGIAGEHFVAAELSKQGWIVALTSKGAASVDILAKLYRHGRPLSIKVKTRTNVHQYAWRVGAPADPLDCDFYVFVDLQDEGKRPLYFVVSTSEVVRLWRNQQIRTEDIRRFSDDWNQLYMAAERQRAES
ncbi:MAG TPA: hypothetical protein VMK12_12075 [Anaeromyxobacteraceae bacterium]|nr:hypothetical protein [Anaeromyxobacteraceae bacterium]